jgi:hypothetical protein
LEVDLPYSPQLNNPVGHEVRDADVRPIVLTGIGLAIGVLLSGLLIYGILRFLSTHEVESFRSNPMAVFDSQIPPAPRIEEHPAIEIQQLRAQEEQMLSTYGWVDKNKGVVRIPLDRAMELQLERGFPTRKEAVRK